MSRINTAQSAAMAAAKAIRTMDKRRTRLKVHHKAPNDLVTNADYAAEKAAIAEILSLYPDDSILSEEYGFYGGNTPNCWVLDPIDGTTNFVHSIPAYSVSLAFCHKGKPIIGVIYDVSSDDMYIAEQGRGARCNDQRIKVASSRKIGDAMIGLAGGLGVGSGNWNKLGPIIAQTAGMRRTGSAAIDLALVARGSLAVVIARGLQFWDYAAAAVLINEAGGSFEALSESEFKPVFGEKVPDFICGAPRMVAGIQRRLKGITD